ncbi:MAG: hypothetical protein WCG23_09850 [bacterium]
MSLKKNLDTTVIYPPTDAWNPASQQRNISSEDIFQGRTIPPIGDKIKEEEILDDNNIMNDIYDKLDKIEKENIEIKKDVEWISRTVLPTVIAVGAILLTALIFGYDSLNNNVSSYNSNVNTKFEMINQRFTDQERYNDQKIENEVNKARLKK